MLSLVKNNYKSYVGERSFHLKRFALMLLFSLFMGAFFKNGSLGIFDTIALSVSILLGFTFSTLTSNITTVRFDLPEPVNESDRFDQDRLRLMSENFRSRSYYFIAISIFELIAIFFIRIDLSIVDSTFSFKWFVSTGFYEHIKIILSGGCVVLFLNFVKFLFLSLGFIAFFEMLYTFYRLSETVLSIIDARQIYLEDHSNGAE